MSTEPGKREVDEIREIETETTAGPFFNKVIQAIVKVLKGWRAPKEDT